MLQQRPPTHTPFHASFCLQKWGNFQLYWGYFQHDRSVNPSTRQSSLPGDSEDEEEEEQQGGAASGMAVDGGEDGSEGSSPPVPPAQRRRTSVVTATRSAGGQTQRRNTSSTGARSISRTKAAACSDSGSDDDLPRGMGKETKRFLGLAGQGLASAFESSGQTDTQLISVLADSSSATHALTRTFAGERMDALVSKYMEFKRDPALRDDKELEVRS
jgi:hypothetical protein